MATAILKAFSAIIPACLAVESTEHKDGTSLIQLPIVDDHPSDPSLPGITVEKLLTEPTGVFLSLSSETNQLASTLEEMRRENSQALATQKELFESKLKKQYRENDDITAQNSALLTRVNTLKATNAQLRSSAKQLDSFNSQLRDDVRKLQANLSNAQEYLSLTLTNLDDSESSDLKVLNELDEKEEMNAQIAAHAARLGDITSLARHATSMLQEAHLPHAQMPTELLQRLETNLADLAQEEKTSEANLKTLFLRDFTKAAAHNAELLKERSSLTSLEANLTTLKQKLTDAILSLETTHHRLTDRLLSLRHYVARLGGADDGKPPADLAAAAAAAEVLAKAHSGDDLDTQRSMDAQDSTAAGADAVPQAGGPEKVSFMSVGSHRISRKANSSANSTANSSANSSVNSSANHSNVGKAATSVAAAAPRSKTSDAGAAKTAASETAKWAERLRAAVAAA